eukprot:6501357-Prymnesium_polylepis.1
MFVHHAWRSWTGRSDKRSDQLHSPDRSQAIHGYNLRLCAGWRAERQCPRTPTPRPAAIMPRLSAQIMPHRLRRCSRFAP